VADLFVSYKSEDRARVKPLVEAFEADGLSVWWDAHIEAGDGWRQRIQTELDAARCVLVVWTKRSVGPEGRFVHDEATRAQRRGVCLPVLLDKVEPPLGFGEVQALPLSGWKGDRGDVRYQVVLAAARAVVSGAPQPAGSAVSGGPLLGRRAMLGGGVALGAAALGGAGWYFLRLGAAEPRAESIAVLPFANLSGDPTQAYFSDGIAEELRSALSRIAGLKVAARNSSEKMREADVKEAAERLGVAHVLTGSVRKGGGKVRVTTQLLNGETGLEEWSGRYDRPEGDVLVVQTGIAENVANALSLTLGRAATMLGGTRNPAAYDAYLRAQAIPSGSEARYLAALEAYDLALAADPAFAVAHANRAITLVDLFGAIDVEKPAEAKRSLDQAEAAAKRAISIEPRLPIAHTALALVRLRQLNLKEADTAFARALSLPGTVSRDLSVAADFQSQMGRADAALALADRALVLDPLNPARQRTRILVLMDARRAEAALAAMDAVEVANPEETFSARTRARGLMLANRPKEAVAVAARIPIEWQRQYTLAVAHAMLGDRASSDKALAQLKQGYEALAAYQIASVLAVQGETGPAFAALGRAVETRDPGLLDLRVDPTLDSLRKDPRYAAIERQVGFPPA
jgi:serine/threonine-protein kinase